MLMEIPSTLIRKIQAGLREKAGVPSYDSTDQSLPSFHDALSKAAAEDPSVPSYLRCNRCNRKLLGGIRSTLCIFCGQQQRREGFSHSVSFTSTTAYRNLLQSLGLNGSEAINLDIESNDSTKSPDTPNSGLVLSNLLSLELRWPSEKEDTVNSDTNKDPVTAPAVILSGVDLDSYFSDSRNETASSAPTVSSDYLMPKEQDVNIESSVSSGVHNLNLFENVQSLNMEITSTKTVGGYFDDSFTDWKAEFQSASSETFPPESQSINHIQGTFTAESVSPVTAAATFSAEYKAVDLFHDYSGTEFANHSRLAPTLSQDTDIQPETSNIMTSGEPTTGWGQFTPSGEQVPSDLWPYTADDIKITGETNDKIKNEVQILTPIDNSWGQVEFPTGIITDSNVNRNKCENDDIFEDSSESWDDFTISKEASRVLTDSSLQTGSGTTPHAPTRNLVDIRDMEFGSFKYSDTTSGALFDLEGSTEVNEMGKTASASTSSVKEFKAMKTVKDDSSLEIWQDFTSSNETPTNMSNLNQTGTEASSNDHIFGTKKFVDQQDMEFASFVHSDSSGGLGRQKGSSEVNEVSASFSSINEFNSTKDINDDNSWESWQDFTGSKEVLGGFANSLTTGTGATSIEPASGISSVEPPDMEFGSFSQSHPFSEVGGCDGSKKVITIEIDGLFSTSSTEGCSNTETMKDNSYPFEAWHFLTSSNEAPGGLSNLSTQTGTETTSHEATSWQKSSNEGNDNPLDALVSVSGTKEFTNTNYADPFEPSKDLTSFHDSTGGLSNLLTQTGRTSALNECASVVKSVDLQDTESGISLPSDYFSGALDGQKGSIEVNNKQFDASISRNRINGTDEERVVSSTVQGAPMSDEYSNDSDLETSNSKIEKLISDMPNLSFMLDSNLSIPKKIDGSYLNSS